MQVSIAMFSISVNILAVSEIKSEGRHIEFQDGHQIISLLCISLAKARRQKNQDPILIFLIPRDTFNM